MPSSFDLVDEPFCGDLGALLEMVFSLGHGKGRPERFKTRLPEGTGGVEHVPFAEEHVDGLRLGLQDQFAGAAGAGTKAAQSSPTARAPS